MGLPAGVARRRDAAAQHARAAAAGLGRRRAARPRVGAPLGLPPAVGGPPGAPLGCASTCRLMRMLRISECWGDRVVQPASVLFSTEAWMFDASHHIACHCNVILLRHDGEMRSHVCPHLSDCLLGIAKSLPELGDTPFSGFPPSSVGFLLLTKFVT